MGSSQPPIPAPVAPDVGARIAALEGRLANSWATYTRDEYEKNLREGIKQDILSYVNKVAISILLFLGGAGALFIGYAVKTSYQAANRDVIRDLRAQYSEQMRQDRIRIEWQRYHNYGVTYRYLAQLYSLSAIDPASKKERLVYIFNKAQTYYKRAHEKDPLQSTTHFELAQLHHTYAHDFDVPEQLDDDIAFNEYQQAVDLTSAEDASRGWRAQALTMMAEIDIQRYKSVSQSFPDRSEFLKKAEAFLDQASREYGTANPDNQKDNEEYVRKNAELVRELKDLKKSQH